jgi:hypothetical protein
MQLSSTWETKITVIAPPNAPTTEGFRGIRRLKMQSREGESGIKTAEKNLNQKEKVKCKDECSRPALATQSPHFSRSSSFRKSGSSDAGVLASRPTIECTTDTPLPAGVTLNEPSNKMTCRETSANGYHSRSPG